jgi:hypothetical protein
LFLQTICFASQWWHSHPLQGHPWWETVAESLGCWGPLATIWRINSASDSPFFYIFKYHWTALKNSSTTVNSFFLVYIFLNLISNWKGIHWELSNVFFLHQNWIIRDWAITIWHAKSKEIWTVIAQPLIVQYQFSRTTWKLLKMCSVWHVLQNSFLSCHLKKINIISCIFKFCQLIIFKLPMK